MPKAFKTLFHDYVCPEPELAGTHASVRDGLDIPGGQKGTRGKMPEVTLVDVKSGPGVNDKVTGGTGDILGNPGVRQSRRKMG